ncbi:MAG: YHYH protein [Bacteroidetes bacterium]|nr:YHYH protein [Bacteroidota bacterium]
MLKNNLLFTVLTLMAYACNAQVTDPMIINWWFNTTNNKYNSILTDVEAVYYTTSNVYVKTSGVPNYYKDGVTHNNAKDLKAVWVLPRTQSAASSPTGPQGGQHGLMLDGSVSFTAGDAQSYNNAGVWNRLAYYFEGMDMDAANGHSTPTNMYHHHFDNLALHTWDSSKHSPIVGYAWDGYPIYGPFGYKNTDGTGGITRMRTSYSTKSYTTRTNGPAVNSTYPIGCFIEDWQYTASYGDLDEHNGRFCKTPEYPAGTYCYFTTVDASLKPEYPYFIGPTLYGNYSNSNTGPTGGTATVPSGATQYIPTTGVKETEAIEANVKLFPVPVHDYLTVELQDSKSYRVTVYNAEGKVMENKDITGTTKIDMNNYAYGVYFVGLHNSNDGTGFIKRIVKQ